MVFKRRDLIVSAGLGATVASLSNLIGSTDKSVTVSQTKTTNTDQWQEIRNQFNLDPNFIHLAGLLITSHPKPVREAIAQYRNNLNNNPGLYLPQNNSRLQAEARQAVGRYLGARSQDLALVDSTTAGIALVINGLQIREDQEMLSANFDYYSTHEALRYQANRSGANLRKFSLYQNIQTVSAEEIVDNLIDKVRSQTRVVTATWVHSSTGLKVPIRQIADRLAQINNARSNANRILFLVDGVHGLGVEDNNINDLGCDFFMAGTHKWMFAPRGTGIIWGNPKTQTAVSPTIPTFTRTGDWGGSMTPGGFKSFEHLWAMTQAFEFHQQMGKARVSDRIHSLSRQLKEGLSTMSNVTLHTPMDDSLSAGIVCFSVDGLNPSQVVSQLRQRNIIASVTPYSPSYARLTPGVYNNPEEIERVLTVIRELA
ncbi:aminotransferase class V [Stanieria cyanosphaera PCC 7437]|uniref:Aminotransferase class V n=1 Tax=Stanieria cyanosphaera (strain ATCC 29371 / PCC 7437) TaxID=111780 RepID=K9XQ49_STAC7|nr:aminotransferase class V-fold PLP-dependent enzyme [Stanieria cyanosphaera]AFZ33797.1 aminotransferase class V [Stanieria cyanosphaera PCC 7437]